MKFRGLASALSVIALLASGTWSSVYAVTFTPPSTNNAPRQSTGGASRGNFFNPVPGKGAPKQTTGGASRGNLFTPVASKGAPRQTTGGASRGNLFTPVAGKGTPRQTTGGASRGNLFTPVAGKGTPRQATGGASRGDLFTPVDGKGTPRQATGGASRVGTYYLNPSTVSSTGPAALIALLPQNYYGTTVSERPTILVHIPASGAKEAVFSLKDEQGNTQYQTTISIDGQSGIVGIKLPAEAPTLAVGKNYQWFLAVKVDGQLSPSTPYVDGWIQRIQPNAELAAAMQEKDPLKRATAFGKHGVWYDCVNTLAGLYSQQNSNVALTKQWEELLSSVSLQEIVKAPVLVAAN